MSRVSRVWIAGGIRADAAWRWKRADRWANGHGRRGGRCERGETPLAPRRGRGVKRASVRAGARKRECGERKRVSGNSRTARNRVGTARECLVNWRIAVNCNDCWGMRLDFLWRLLDQCAKLRWDFRWRRRRVFGGGGLRRLGLGGAGGPGLEELLFAVDQGVDVVGG